jgi:hydroxymethylpyrimidine pyrophosphatase-like HAD family hydrolase
MIFACDIDNTLIYSHKRMSDSNSVCVETKDGKSLSYMTNFSYNMFSKLNCNLILVTTRSIEQYKRITFPVVPEYTLVCNGAILLKNGNIDNSWLKETKKLLYVECELILEYYKQLQYSSDIYDIRLADGFFIFSKFISCEKAKEIFNSIIDKSKFDVILSYNKIYIMPKLLNKGFAVKRAINYLNLKDLLICAGDSELDLPMLKIADKSFVPNDFNFGDNYVKSDKNIKYFSDFLLKSILNLQYNK